MGIPVLILGESGTGKSASLRNFKPSDLKVINVANKPLPFKNKFESISTDDYKTIIKELKLNKKKVSVIDDAQYLMANEFMRRATERGFDKFTEIAQNFWNLVNVVKDLPADQVVYFLAHIERDANGNEKIKTIGKLLDEKITVEGMFTIVLKTNVTDGQYSFVTQNSGHDTVKSPIGMFPSVVIDNDLKYVDEKIRNYYEIGDFLTDEEIAEIDEAAKKDDIPIADEKPKRGRKRAKKEEPENTPQEEKKEEAAKPDPTADVQSDTDVGSETAEKPKRRRRNSDKSREEVMEENAEKVANAGIEEAGDADEVLFEEVQTPELEKVPRRTRKQRDDEVVRAMNEPESQEEQAAEETATPRRRRRRS
nr:MAG TPA: AAA domain protein [Caudoviricetes sp.]